MCFALHSENAHQQTKGRLFIASEANYVFVSHIRPDTNSLSSQRSGITGNTLVIQLGTVFVYTDLPGMFVVTTSEHLSPLIA